MSGTRRGWALVAAAALTALAACSKPGSDSAGAAKGTPASAPAAGSAKAATVLLLALEDVATLQPASRSQGPVITGSIQPEKRADLRAEVSAVVLQVHKENGEPVRRGDLLVTLDATTIRDNLASARESERAAAQALEQAERSLQRQRMLQAQGMTSQQGLEDAEMRRNSAQSEHLAAKARVASAAQQLARTEVRAPFDGVVSEKRASAGDTAQVGKELLKVIDPRSMRFEGLVSADRIHEVKVGQKVAFRVNGYPGVDFAGQIRRVDAAANATTRQLEVLVAFAGGELPKVAGLYAEGRIESGTVQVLALPESAIQRAGDVASAWRIDGPRVKRVALQLGERDERSGDVEIKAGLAAGDRYLRRPGATLVDGQSVEWMKPAAPAAAASAVVSAASAPAAK
ncbi:MAG: efflux RND transporter periplasmic adaptor subunit [Rubrivivax sp.]|nr:efflux RND transporter periplasmic adaptor subunit [Rubrivivax sp.]